MADVKDKQFLRGEVRDMVRVGVPALQKAVEILQIQIAKLVVKVSGLEEVYNHFVDNAKVAKPKTKKVA